MIGLVAGLSRAAVAQAPADLKIAPSDSERRVALVIGNGAYQNAGQLANPVNDARAMAAKLKKVGFDVIEVENGTQQSMRRAIGQFSNKLTAEAVSLFYYAGHGMQVNGHNYLIPIDAEITTEQTVGLETIDVDRVIDQMSMAKSRVNLVILDACRNNPYERRFRSQSGGLATMEAPTGTLIAYATSPGKVAADGDTGNGLYTSELIKAIDVRGASVAQVFQQVRRNVVARSKGEQTPWEATSLTGDFFFSSPTAIIMSAPQGGTLPDHEVVLWTSVKDSRNPALIQTYLDRFPQGVFAGAAKVMIDDLKKGQIAGMPAKPDLTPGETTLAIEEIEGAYITVKRANVREKPTAEGKLIKSLDPGVSLTVTGKVKDAPWYRVFSADGKLRGFVFGDAIKTLRQAEAEEWPRVKDAKQSTVVAAFLRRYPTGVYADQATTLRDTLLKAEQMGEAGAAKSLGTPPSNFAPPSSVQIGATVPRLNDLSSIHPNILASAAKKFSGKWCNFVLVGAAKERSRTAAYKKFRFEGQVLIMRMWLPNGETGDLKHDILSADTDTSLRIRFSNDPVETLELKDGDVHLGGSTYERCD